MKKIVVLGIVTLIVIAGTIWACRRHRVDPQVQKVLKMQEKVFDPQVPVDRRLAMGSQIRSDTGKLAPDQRRQVFGQILASFQRLVNQRAAAYYKLPPDQRTAYLDQQIAELQRWRQAMGGQPAAGQSQGGSGQDGGNTPSGNGSGGLGSRLNAGTMDQQTRNQFRLQWLDNSTPEQRAQLVGFVQDLGQRCEQLGVPPPKLGGRL